MVTNIERTILDRALTQDPAALAELVSRVTPSIERQLMRYPVSDEDRKDLLQATLMQVVRRLSSFRGDSSFSTWLFRVTANEALMMLRSQRRHRARVTDAPEFEALAERAVPLDGPKPGLDDEAEDRERATWIRTALAELPDEYRDVVVAHYHLELGLQEIADRMEISESAVRSRLHRARTRLRTLLDKTPVRETRQAA